MPTVQVQTVPRWGYIQKAHGQEPWQHRPLVTFSLLLSLRISPLDQWFWKQLATGSDSWQISTDSWFPIKLEIRTWEHLCYNIWQLSPVFRPHILLGECPESMILNSILALHCWKEYFYIPHSFKFYVFVSCLNSFDISLTVGSFASYFKPLGLLDNGSHFSVFLSLMFIYNDYGSQQWGSFAPQGMHGKFQRYSWLSQHGWQEHYWHPGDKSQGCC